MSSGPIKAWRDSWLPERVSAVTGERACAQVPGTLKSECGRKPKLLVSASDPTMNCPECKAALLSDLESTHSGESP